MLAVTEDGRSGFGGNGGDLVSRSRDRILWLLRLFLILVIFHFLLAYPASVFAVFFQLLDQFGTSCCLYPSRRANGGERVQPNQPDKRGERTAQ